MIPWMLVFLVFAPISENTDGLPGFRSFQDPAEVDEEAYLANPYSMVFDKEGRLFVVDRFTHKVYVWKADGSFEKSFGRQGEGPGELFFPYQLDIAGERLFVIGQNAQVSIFDLEGTYLDSFKHVAGQIRNFAALSEDLLLLNSNRFEGPSEVYVDAVLLTSEGEVVETLKTWKNQMFMAPIEGNNNTTIKAFGGEMVIQRAPDGTHWFGYSYDRTLYQVDAKGKLVGERRFDLSTSRPTEEDIELYNTMSFPSPDGGRLALKDLPNLKVDYTHDKAYYTQFAILGDKVIFVLHPLGGTNGVAYGFYKAEYVVADFQTGKPLYRGRYAYPEDSQLLLQHGHILGVLVNDEDGYDLRELHLENNRLAGN